MGETPEAKPKFQHDESTLELKNTIHELNVEFDGYAKIVMYWSRAAIGLQVDQGEGLKQAPGMFSVLGCCWRGTVLQCNHFETQLMCAGGLLRKPCQEPLEGCSHALVAQGHRDRCAAVQFNNV